MTGILTFNNRGCVFSRKLAEFAEIIHGVSTRKFGNMHHKFGDASASERNRAAFLKKFGVSSNALVMPQIVHGTSIAIVGKEHAETLVKEVDGIVTNVPEVFVSTFGADCVPILAYDPVRQVVGAVHAGWMGTLGLISQKLITVMRDKWRSEPSDIVVYLGPSIGPCHYDQREDKADGPRGESFSQFRKVFPDSVKFSKDGVAYIDLWLAHKKQLIDVGVKEKNIEISGLCTVCHNDVFYSNHVERENLGGAIMAFIGIKGSVNFIPEA
ncbi:peptidoglycan editing factor PgeF [Candidatus Bathyarchaeota archaeon]|nr:MAG: peptidoglycan editing factor PgeF [Candidatus Bathyarchaeota archaeon]